MPAQTAEARIVAFPGGLDIPSIVPPGDYQLAFLDYETRTMFKHSHKLMLWFRIVDPGVDFGLKLARYYNVHRLMGQRGRHRMFKVGFHSEFVREYALLFNTIPPRLDRIPMTVFQNRIVSASVRTVTQDHLQRDRPEVLQYSVIRKLKALIQ